MPEPADFAKIFVISRVFIARNLNPPRLTLRTPDMKSILPALAIVAAFLSSSARGEESGGLGAVLPAVLHDAKGEEVALETLKGKTVALYFSAHWCPPCRAFTPSLVKFRDEHAEQDFEIVFVSLDNSEGEKKTYISEMDMKWLTVPGASSPEAQKLAQKFQIRGIPSLIVLGPDGSVVTANGREDVMIAPDKALQKWKEKDPS